MESLKNLLPNRTISPQWIFVGQFALVFGVLTLGVLWLITPPPSSVSQVQTMASTSRSTTASTQRSNAPVSEVSDLEEQATTQTSEPPAPEAESSTPAAETTASVSTPVTQTVATPPPALPFLSTPTTLLKPLPPKEVLPELISLASDGTQKYAVLRLGSVVQTVAIADRIGAWQVQQIRSAQVVIQQGKRTVMLSFGGSTSVPPAINPNNSGRPTPTFQPPSEENRPPQPNPQPPQVDNGSDGNAENENNIDR